MTHPVAAMRLLVAFLVLMGATALRAADPTAIRTEAVESPAVPGSFGGATSVGADGTAWLTWLERRGDGAELRVATFDATARRWSAPQTIARYLVFPASSSGAPALSAGERGQAAVAWMSQGTGETARASAAGPAAVARPGAGHRAWWCRTTDGGRTWSAPAPLTTESAALDRVTLATLADGRLLAAWLDGRASANGPNAAQLFARVIGTSGPDTLVEPRACECCRPSLTALPDGSALLAYHGRTADEIRDVRTARFRRDAWEPSQGVHDDRWKTSPCPGDGPQLASDGGRIAAAWFTGADDNPRVLASLSPDAGARFLLPLQLSETRATGRISTALLHDGAVLVTWADAAGGVWLRRITPDFTLADPVALVSPGEGTILGAPQLSLLEDYHGGKAPARLLLTYVTDREPTLRTRLVAVPEGDLLEAEKNCDCSGNSEDIQGFSLRGRILAGPETGGGLRVAHYDVPGIFEPGERTFPLAPEVKLPAAVAGREFLGRFERREGRWVLFSVRLIGSAP